MRPVNLGLTERQQRRADSEQRFQSIFDHAAIGIGVVNAQGHVVESNLALCKMFGYTSERCLSWILRTRMMSNWIGAYIRR